MKNSIDVAGGLYRRPFALALLSHFHGEILLTDACSRGERVIIPPPRNVEALKQRMARTDMEHVDFYLGFKKL